MYKRILITLLTVFMTLGVLSPIRGESTLLKEEQKKIVICIDPGHQLKGDNRGEPIAPNSGIKKARVSSGTSGVATKKNEYEVNLKASLILKELLLAEGYEVVMTRETNEVNISNAERAEIANNAKANMTIRVHCDSVNDSGKTGATLLVPSKDSKYTKEIYKDSFEFAKTMKEELQKSGVKVNNICERGDITGFNWSRVPVVIFEMGFMSNYNEDRNICSEAYEKKLMEAVVKALNKTYKEQ